jgi:hypothetical protein
MQNGLQPDKPYTPATGEKAVSGLDLLIRIFGPRLVTDYPLPSSAQACEWQIGCGTGHTARWVSTHAGAGFF